MDRDIWKLTFSPPDFIPSPPHPNCPTQDLPQESRGLLPGLPNSHRKPFCRLLPSKNVLPLLYHQLLFFKDQSYIFNNAKYVRNKCKSFSTQVFGTQNCVAFGEQLLYSTLPGASYSVGQNYKEITRTPQTLRKSLAFFHRF